MSSVQHIIKNTGWLYAKMLVSMVCQFLATRLLLSGLGASDFGIYNIVGGAIGLFGFLNSTMASTTQRFINYSEGQGDKYRQKQVFNVGVIIHFCLAVLLALILFVAGFWLFNGGLTIPEERVGAALFVYGSLIVSTLFTVMTVPYESILNAHENMRYFSIVGMLDAMLKLAAAVACVYWFGDKLVIYGVFISLISILLLVIMRVYCHKKYAECHIDIRQYFSKSLLKEMLGFAGWNFLTAISSLVTVNGLNIVVNHFFGVLLNAAQGVAHQLAGAMTSLSVNAQKAINPVIVKTEAAGNSDKVCYILLITCRLGFFLTGLLILPLILMTDFVMDIWLKEVPEWAVLFCQLQCVRILLEQMTNGVGPAIYATGNIKNYTIYKSIVNIMPLVIVPIAFHFGMAPYWLYIIWIICWNIFGTATAIYFAHVLVGLSIKDYLQQVLQKCLIVVGITVVPFFVLKSFNPTLIVTLVGIAVDIILFVVLGWFVIMNQNERQLVHQMVTSKLKK